MSGRTKEWERPASVPTPTVWRRCDGLREMADGKIPKFRIQDVPDDRHEDIVKFMTEHFCRDEATCASLKVLEDPVSVQEVQEIWRKMLNQKVALVAFLEGSEEEGKPKIAGCNVTGITNKGEKYTPDMFQGRCSKIIVRDIVGHATNVVNVFERYGVNEYMTAMGLCVDPVFRGQGVGLEILKARFDMGRAVGLELTMTIFTGIASQKLAHKVGMEVLAEIEYETYQDDGKPAYPNINCKSLKVMAKRIE